MLFAVAPTPACIIPVGPDWHDPYGAPNAPPQILDPAPGEVAVTTIPTQPINFRIVVTDVNVNDDLEIKWFVDTDERFHLLPLVKHTGTQLRVLADKTVTCSDISPPNRGLPSHVVRAVVADRPIVGVDPLTITAPGLFDDRFWTLNMACQQ